MVFIKISEGLGNQFFKYACGYAVARNNNDKEIIIDRSGYAFRPHSYQLDQFNISAIDGNFMSTKADNKIARGITRVSRLIKINKYGLCKNVKEKVKTQMKYAPYDFSYKKSIYIEGYWQNEKYFKKYYNDLKKEFSPKEGVISEKAKDLMKQCHADNSVALHIRRGNYAKEWLLPENFYKKALEIINDNITNPIIYIFCEDIEYVKQNYGHLQNSVFVTEKYKFTDIEEFFLISSCKNQIIANSTFSWWAAYLNDNPQKRVIAPDYKQWTGDYYPKGWTTIKC